MDLAELLEPLESPKSFQQLLQEGIQHSGGLAQLAQAEQQAEARRRAEPGSISGVPK